jgi:hypothetical protein
VKYLLIVFISFNSLFLLITGCSSSLNSNSAPTKSGEIVHPTTNVTENAVNPFTSSSVPTSTLTQSAITINTPSVSLTPTPSAVEVPVLTPSPAPTTSPNIMPTLTVQPGPTNSENMTNEVNSDQLIRLQSLKNLKVKTAGYRTYISNLSPYLQETPKTYVFNTELTTVDMPVTWNGTAFSGYWSVDTSYVDPDPRKQDGARIIKATFSGIVSEDGKNLINLVYIYDSKTYPYKYINHKVIDPRYYFVQLITIQLQNVPLNNLLNQTAVEEPGQILPNKSIDIIGFEEAGSQIQNYFANLEYYEGSSGTEFRGTSILSGNKYISTDWTAKGTNAPTLSVVFSK